MLDTWVKGSVLFKGSLYLEDTLNRRQSRMLTLVGAGMGDARVLAGPTDDGWFHIQVKMQFSSLSVRLYSNKRPVQAVLLHPYMPSRSTL